ncbi:MAG: hypothetical protein O3A20_05505 [Planctomycetota bacterium]|nr:hypothetical protein [Planctomycetota bacterium]
MRLVLFLPWWRAIIGRRAWIAVPVGALIAAVLALDPVLGPEDGFGTYLAYCSLLPLALLFRLGGAIDARRRDGLEIEEALRDPAGSLAPSAAILAAWSALAAGLAVCALPPLILSLAVEDFTTPALHPVHIKAQDTGAWTFDAGGAIPFGSALLLTFTWEQLPEAGAELHDGAGVLCPIQPGEIVRSPLRLEEARSGQFTRMVNEKARAAGAVLVRPLVRLEVPRPPLTAAPRLLGRQFMFAAPLLGLVLLLARRGRAGGALAALAAVALAGLLAFDPFEVPQLGKGPADLLARAVLALRAALPEVRGLAAVGRGFELRTGTSSPWMVTAWWLLGTLAVGFCFRWRKRP